MKVISFNRILDAMPIDRKNFKQHIEENKFVPTKEFSRAEISGWVPIVNEFEDLVFEFKGKYFLRIAVSTKKIQKKMLHAMIERHIEENPIEQHFFSYATSDPEEQDNLRKQYYCEIENNILLDLEPTTDYYDVVYSTGKDDVTTIAIESKSGKVRDSVMSLFRETFGAYEETFHIGLDYDMTDFLKSLVVDDILVDDLSLGEKVKLQDPDEKSTTIDYKGFDLEELEDIREWITNKGMAVANVEMSYKDMVFVLDNKYMFSGVKPLVKHVIDAGIGDATLYDFMAGKIDDYFQMEEVQLELESKY